ncbi:MAG: potassium/proton antiporter [bacterium]
MGSLEEILLVVGLLLTLSILASKASGRFGVPALLIFLVIGMLAGSDGPGGIYFDNDYVAQSLGVLALAYILFSGGLETKWKDIRPVLAPGLGLATLGVLLTAGALAVAVKKFLGFTWPEAFLLGAIVSSTDAAAVFSVLRSRNVGLQGRLKPLLELESGSNDPMAVFLSLGLIELIKHPQFSLWRLFPSFLQQMALGAALGYGLGRLVVWAINRIKLNYEGLYPVFTLSLVLVVYGLTAYVGGNGFLAVYVAGMAIGNQRLLHKKSLTHFHDGLAWLMQIAMFLTLGLLVFPKQLASVAWAGLLTSFLLIFLARPIAVFLTLSPFRFRFREKALVSWVGLKGAVPIVLATFPRLADIPQADNIFNLVFFIVLTSVLLQGTTIPVVARWLGVDAPLAPQKSLPLEFEPIAGQDTDLSELLVPYQSPAAGKKIVELGWPPDSLIALIARGEDFLVPTGASTLEAGDVLLSLVQPKDLPQIRNILGLGS